LVDGVVRSINGFPCSMKLPRREMVAMKGRSTFTWL
jgi:hypothetical protein